MAYSTHMAAALSGATVNQLRSWRINRGAKGQFLMPELGTRPRAAYSFRDVLALRTCVRLRQDFSLQKIRTAIGTLRGLGETAHLASYQLVTDGSSIVLYDDEHPTDLLDRPGQRVVATLTDILEPFAPRPGVVVPHLLRPATHVAVDPANQGGHPVITGTRVPYEAVAELLEDGVPLERIPDYYPAVTVDAARDAAEFARYVDSYLPSGSRAA
jgi:uncharacterized protein (DUF433 family)